MAVAPTAEQQPAERDHRRRRPAIVVVDDEPAVLAAVARDLRREFGERYRIVRAGSGDEALGLVRELVGRGDQVALLGFAGVAIVGLHQASAASAAGVLLLLAGAVSWTVGTLVTSASDEPIMALVVGQHLVGAPLLVAVAALAEPFPGASAKLLLSVAYVGAFGSALAWILLSTLLRRGEAGVVSTWLFAVPVLAATLGVVLLGEPLTLELVAGIALVAAAVRLAA